MMITEIQFSFPVGYTVAMQSKDGGLWMHGVIEEGSGVDHNGWSCKVRVTKKGRQTTHKTRHIHKTLLMTEHHLREQIVKGTLHLEDIFTDTKRVRHNRACNPYMACTQMNIYHKEKQEDKMPVQNSGVSVGKIWLMASRTMVSDMKSLRLRPCKAGREEGIVKQG